MAGKPPQTQNCGLRRFLAVFCWRSLSLVADDEGAGGCFDDVVGDGFELVDFQYTGDLGEEPLEEAEVAAGDPFDRGDAWASVKSSGSRVGRGVSSAVEDEQEFVATEAGSGGRSRGGCRAGVVAESLVDAGHADEDDPEVGAVVVVAEEFQGCRGSCSASSMMSSSTSLVMPFMMRGVVASLRWRWPSCSEAMRTCERWISAMSSLGRQSTSGV